jgi:hypothetical protein
MAGWITSDLDLASRADNVDISQNIRAACASICAIAKAAEDFLPRETP